MLRVVIKGGILSFGCLFTYVLITLRKYFSYIEPELEGDVLRVEWHRHRYLEGDVLRV